MPATADILIAPRFRGPPDSGNGGYTCGLVAARVGEPAEVTLRRPPPLARRLRLEWRDAGETLLVDDDTIVAQGRPATLELLAPSPVSVEEAERASLGYPGFDRHTYPTCFVCGPARAEGDGLRIFAGWVRGHKVVASPWTPDPSLADEDGRVRREFVWATLDCPGAVAVGFPDRGEMLLGRLTAEIDRAPTAGEPCVVVGWPLGEKGRKLYAGTALYSASGKLLARARAVWIRPA
jgi:hypothetical protein